MSDIYLIRHGFTPANNASYNGQNNLFTIADNRNMPLDIVYGRKQAKEIGNYLKNIKGKILIYVSPYRRCKETLKIALKDISNISEIVEIEDLREIDSGVHYARTKNEVLSMYPDSIKVYESKKIDPLGTKYLYGESELDVKNRVKSIALEIKKVSKRNEYDNIFVFGHGSVNRWLSYWICDDYINHTLKNGEIIEIKNGKQKTIFIPSLVVPVGYIVDIEKHKKITYKC